MIEKINNKAKIVNRKLWYDTTEKREVISQIELVDRRGPLIILGEAGMGKTHLLGWLSDQPGYTLCTARQLINRPKPKTLLDDETEVLVIDALDEVSSRKQGDAVDLVLQKLGELDYPDFVLSCRVSDWRSATGIEAINEQYSRKPVEFHLVPFDEKDAEAFLSCTLGNKAAKIIVDHFSTRQLNELLGNPQTLELIANVAGSGTLPDTLGELFEQAIEILQVEHRDSKAENLPPHEVGLDAAGAAFASLILTGSDEIVRKSPINASDSNLQLSDISLLPGGEAIELMLGTRLFKSNRSESFTYIHRRVGEYLGARWLAKTADTKQRRRRLLFLFHSHGLVPASLRGIHAWLARDPALAMDIIAADPMGLIEYGDADDLTIDQARQLLKGLEVLANKNPYFREWRPYSLRGVLRPELVEEIRRLITVEDIPFALSSMILQAIKGSNIAQLLEDDVLAIILSKNSMFVSRSVAGQVLIDQTNKLDWPPILQKLYEYGDESSIRVALELADGIAYAGITAELIVDLVIAYVKADAHMGSVLMPIEHALPISRITDVLDTFIPKVTLLGEPYRRPGDNVLTDFAYNLILRALKADGVTAERLWFWLQPFNESAGYDEKTIKQLNAFIQESHHLRRELQQYILLRSSGDDSLWIRENHLCERLSSLRLDEDDIISLIGNLDHADRSDERWRDVIRLIHHDENQGANVRKAAHVFAAHRPDLLTWIDDLARPRELSWKARQAKSHRKFKARQAMAYAEHRKYYAAHIEEVREGKYLVDPAMAYLKLFTDIGDNMPAHQRVAHWLGDQIAAAVHEGFEAFLKISPLNTSVQNITSAMTENKRYNSSLVIVAALAERFRKGIGLDDLTDEHLMAGMFEMKHSRINDHADIKELSQFIEETIQSRGIWEKAIRLYFEPQLAAGCQSIHDLYSFLRDEKHSDLASDLAIEWLERFPDLSIGPESELIDKLLRARRFEELQHVLNGRNNVEEDERRRNYDAIGLIINFSETKQRLDAGTIERELLWHIRNYTGGYHRALNLTLNPLQYAWIIQKLRIKWPFTERPRGMTSGDTNPYDATEYILNCIRRLGNIVSDVAVAALERLRDMETDGYTEQIKVVLAEQIRNHVENAYLPPTLQAINTLTRDSTPGSTADLQAMVIEELEIVQAKIYSDDVDSWHGFYSDKGVPLVEERCRDHLIGLLRQGIYDITFDPEVHVAADKEVDIACSVGKLRLPIEIKGQWHKDLYTGADKQLDRLYTGDWRADTRGIYLVFWFGEQANTKKLKSPGRGIEVPKTPHELREIIVTRSKAAKEGRVLVFVVDAASPCS